MMNFKDLIVLWDKFFFSEKPTYNLAIFRIVWGTLIFFNILFDLGNIADFYGPDAILSLEVVKTKMTNFHFSLFNLFNHSLATSYGIYFFTLFSVFMVTIGCFTRVFLFSALVGIVSLHMRNIWLLSAADVLVRCIFFILVWSPCYNVLSIDSLRAKRSGKKLPVVASQWTWRLIQIQIAVLYTWTTWSKLKGDDWFDGSAVYYATRLDSMKNFTLPWVLDSFIIIKFVTWSTLALEFALGTLVWFKQFRTPVVIGGILLHLGIEYTMAIPFFEWMMIVLLMNFFTPEEFVLFYKRASSAFKELIQKSQFKEGFKNKLISLFDDEELV